MNRCVDASGLSDKEICRRAGIGDNTLSSFLKEDSTVLSPTLAVALAVAKACGVLLSEFVGEIGPASDRPDPQKLEREISVLRHERAQLEERIERIEQDHALDQEMIRHLLEQVKSLKAPPQ